MKKTMYAALITCTLATLFTGCIKKIGGGNVTGFGVKQAKIIYNGGFGADNIIYFDNNGKQFRWETSVAGSPIEADIMDETTGKAYSLIYAGKKYQEIPIANVKETRKTYIFDEKIYKGGLSTKTTETIAGKTCTVYTTMGITSTGGWNNIMFLSTAGGMDIFRATSYSETLPANIFSIPAGFTEQK
jgi:hypothetical protein